MTKKSFTLPNVLPYILIIAGVIGYICAFIIMFDKVKLADNPSYIPSCNLNPIISCGSVMKSAQAHAFGFPNPFLGLGGFAVVATVGAAMLAGGKFKRWFWLSVNAGLLFAVGFCHWLFFESVYRIHALCPWCMGVWAVSITSFWYVTLYNLDQGNIRLPAGKSRKAYGWVRRHHLDILIAWLLIIAALILKHFWYYYGHYF
jgi:uncharacterized membrane protein